MLCHCDIFKDSLHDDSVEYLGLTILTQFKDGTIDVYNSNLEAT